MTGLQVCYALDFIFDEDKDCFWQSYTEAIEGLACDAVWLEWVDVSVCEKLQDDLRRIRTAGIIALVCLIVGILCNVIHIIGCAARISDPYRGDRLAWHHNKVAFIALALYIAAQGVYAGTLLDVYGSDIYEVRPLQWKQ